MPETPVTIVVTCHNDADKLPGLFRDLRMLTHQDYQLVIVDDASTDGTVAVIEEAALVGPPVEAVLLRENLGVARARNRALDVAVGEYVWFIDSDDRLPPDGLAHMLRAASRTGADVVFAKALEVSTGHAPRTRTIDGLIGSGSIEPEAVVGAIARGEIRGFLWSKLLRRASIPGEVFPAVPAQSDFLGLMKVLGAADSFHVIDDVVYEYIRRPGSITTRADPLRSLLATRGALAELCRSHQVSPFERDVAYFNGVLVVLAALDTLIRNDALDGSASSRIRLELRALAWSELRHIRRLSRVAAVRLLLAKISVRGYAVASRVGRRLRVR